MTNHDDVRDSMTNSKKRSGAEIDVELVRQLADVLVASGLTEIECSGADWRVRVAKQALVAPMAMAQPPAAAPAVGAPSPVAEAGTKSEADPFADHPGLLTSPMVGIVYTSAEPSSPAFVSVGDSVAVGDTVLLIEAMKVFNPIKAHRAGRIERMFVSTGMPVEYGEPLLLIA